MQAVKFPFGKKFLELRLDQPARVLLPEPFARACKKRRLPVVSTLDQKELSDMFMTGLRSLPEAAAAVVSNYCRPKILCILYTGQCIPVLSSNLVKA